MAARSEDAQPALLPATPANHFSLAAQDFQRIMPTPAGLG